MRYLSLHLPFLATDRIHRRPEELGAPQPSAAAPLATVAKVKSAYRLVALDAAALACGLKPMTALADARAMHPGLAIRDADPTGDAAARDSIIDWCRLFTPLVAPDGIDGAMLDITGSAHLFGGEAALLDTVVARLARQGFAAAVAAAESPAAAWALARFGATAGGLAALAVRTDPARPPVAPTDLTPADLARVFAPMPLAALRLDERTLGQLAQAGLRRIGDLLLRPRAPLAARFGRDLFDGLDVLLGRAKSPISPRFEAPAFVAERRFAEGIARREDIEGTILALSYDLCGLLARHGEGARLLHVSLFRVDGVVKHIEAGTSRPLRDPLGMARLFRERIEAAGEDGLETGYGFEVVRLAALAAEPLNASQPDWDRAGLPHQADLDDLVDRLGARFGLARVSRMQLADAHQPEDAARIVPAARCARPATGSAKSSAKMFAHNLALADPDLDLDPDDLPVLPDRPIRLLDQPEPIDTMAAVPDGPPLRFRWRRVTHQVAAIEGPERIGPDWWAGGGAVAPSRDYFRAEDTDGRRFWLFREGLYSEVPEPRWFLHGFFA